MTLALTMPDVCASLASPQGCSDRDDYKRWHDDGLCQTPHLMTGFGGKPTFAPGPLAGAKFKQTVWKLNHNGFRLGSVGR